MFVQVKQRNLASAIINLDEIVCVHLAVDNQGEYGKVYFKRNSDIYICVLAEEIDYIWRCLSVKNQTVSVSRKSRLEFVAVEAEDTNPDMRDCTLSSEREV